MAPSRNVPPHSDAEQSRVAESPSKEKAPWSEAQNEDSPTCPYGCCEDEPLGDFVYRRGFLGGACSDITIRAFGKDFNLHKLILDRSGYFSMLFNGPWNDPSNTVHELKFDDPNITKEAFQIALAMLYGAKNQPSAHQHLSSLVAVGQFLDIQSVVCFATNEIIDCLDFENIAFYARFATSQNYGSASDRILESVKGLLCSEGWERGVAAWDEIPCSVIASVVGLDSFYVWSEWERVIFIIKLIERRQRSNKSFNDIEGLETLSDTLNSKVHFCHLTAEQLHKLELWKNRYDEPFVNPNVLKDALWLSVSLHQKVATSNKNSNDLGLVVNSEDPPDSITSWYVPTKDRTLYGTPSSITNQLFEQQQQPTQSTEEPATGKTTENSDSNYYKVTKIPPFRFSVGFNTISEVEPGKRVYARTLWYAGSYWNLYVQKIKHKKCYQMGVYVHRATSSAPSKSGLLNHDVTSRSAHSANTTDPHIGELLRQVEDLDLYDDVTLRHQLRNSIGTEINSPEASDDEQSDVGTEVAEENEDDDTDSQDLEDADGSFLSYEDQRLNTSVYCIIYTPSRKVKSSLTCFMSTPELFKKSQSWGWKSNSMCSFNDDGTLSEGQENVLKFMVVLGNV